MENHWLTWVKRLQAIGSTGLHFGESPYDKERYEEISSIANAMLGDIGNIAINQITATFPDIGQGYVTPKVDVRGALIRNGKILLVQEKLDQLWTLPGGYADVGLSPAENVAKEFMEEANVRVTATRLYGVFHKAKHDYAVDARDFYKFFFLCESDDREVEPRPGMETRDARFFDPEDLPPLSTGRVIEEHILGAFSFALTDGQVTIFD